MTACEVVGVLVYLLLCAKLCLLLGGSLVTLASGWVELFDVVMFEEEEML